MISNALSRKPLPCCCTRCQYFSGDSCTCRSLNHYLFLSNCIDPQLICLTSCEQCIERAAGPALGENILTWELAARAGARHIDICEASTAEYYLVAAWWAPCNRACGPAHQPGGCSALWGLSGSPCSPQQSGSRAVQHGPAGEQGTLAAAERDAYAFGTGRLQVGPSYHIRVT